MERVVQAGILQGVQQGPSRPRQGVKRGQAGLPERQLRLRSGELPKDVRRRIAEADERTPLAWSVRLLSAGRLENVLD